MVQTRPPIGNAIIGSTVIFAIGLSAKRMITTKGPRIAVRNEGNSLVSPFSRSDSSTLSPSFFERRLARITVTISAQIAGIAPGPILRDGALKLAGRFNPKVGAIKSWESGKRGQYPVIIDNMLNLELLMRAARYFQLDTLRSIAITHARTTLRTHFRDDFTTFHLVDFDPQTGAVTARKTVQGYSDESVWARGEAWALYGYAMMARECAKSGLTAESREFLAQATGIGKWVAAHLPADGIPYWDFSDPDRPNTWRDASAAAILASAFLDLARQLDSQDATLAKRFRKLAKRQLKTLASAPYLAKAGQNGGFLLRHCVGNLPAGSEIDVPLTYADYYFLEALLRWRR